MDSTSVKLDLLERVAGIKDEAVIKKMAALLRKAFPEVMTGGPDDEITDEEFAAFEAEVAARDRGEVRFHTEEESIRLIREGSGE